MSVMGMRDWLHNNRTAMLVIFALLLVGLLITYGKFGQSSSYSEADYEAMVENAREVYNADPTNADSVYTLAQTLGAYAEFLTDKKAERERIDEVDLESVKYYDEYYALMVDQAKAAYESEKTYNSAAVVSSYLNMRIKASSYLDDADLEALSAESNEWMITAMELRYDEAKAALDAAPNDPALLADMADVKASLAYYKNQKDDSVDMNAAYAEAMQLALQAVDNCTGEGSDANKATYYLKVAGYAQSMENNADAEKYCRLALECDPASYNVQISLASLLVGEGRYADAKTQLEEYLATLSEDDSNYENVEQSIDYLQMMIEAAASDDADDADDSNMDADDAEVQSDPEDVDNTDAPADAQ